MAGRGRGGRKVGYFALMCKWTVQARLQKAIQMSVGGGATPPPHSSPAPIPKKPRKEKNTVWRRPISVFMCIYIITKY